MRYKITIEYDGTDYVGWQKQIGKKSIQSEIESSLLKIAGKKVEIFGSGRTDAGVHAIGQVAHFDFEKEFSEFEMMMALNQHLSSQIAVVKCEKVSDDFHSRFHAKVRHYQYKILNRRPKPILDKNRVWHVAFNLDIAQMEKATEYLIGEHDFTSFRDSECQAKNPVRTIQKIEITKEGDLISIKISAPSFLHHMVRNIIGTLILVGRRKITAEDVKIILKEKDRTKSGPNAPAFGLYFCRAEY